MKLILLHYMPRNTKPLLTTISICLVDFYSTLLLGGGNAIVVKKYICFISSLYFSASVQK